MDIAQFTKQLGTSLVVKWLRVHLPKQGTWVPSLFWEDSTCHRAAGPMRPNYSMLCIERSHHNKKPAHHNEE